MGDLWLLLLLPLSLAALHGVKGCLECDPKFIEDIRTLLTNLVPSEVPGRNQLLERQFKETIHLSSKVSHGNKMLRVLAVQKVVKLRTWLKNEFYRLGNETWKGVFIFQGKLLEIRQKLEPKVKETLTAFSEVACSEDCSEYSTCDTVRFLPLFFVTEGPVLDCWTCLRITTRCFRGEYCREEDPRKAEQREITLFLVLLAEAGILILYVCLSSEENADNTKDAKKISGEET
uniref:izumo sperm-egg fusion protein 3 isoform X3 n=1 Tax=Ictidomys tridecemlineatus TaxID=43179 RepID=UPI001A9F9D01|nr:izumo sperm-egg fusion protein 3 isoform X3 [Ictidomys tridecemlineatus]